MRRHLPWCAAGLIAVLLTGCTAYRPAPLAPEEAVLAVPDLAILSADAAKIDRPYLTPQPVDLSQPLTLNAVAVIAVLANPDLKALRTRTGVTDAQAFAARLLPDPTGQIGFDKLLSGPDSLSGFAGQLGFDLNALRTRRVNREAGDASKQQVRLDLAWAEWQVSRNAQIQAVRVVSLTRQLEIARTSAASAQDLLARVQKASGRGDLAGTDTDIRRLAVLDASARLRTAERDLSAAQQDLNRLIGLPPELTIRLATLPLSLVPPDAATLTAQAIDRRLDLAALRAGYGVGEANLHKAVLDQFPNLSLTLASARDTAGNLTMGPQIGFALPLWNRNRGGIAVASATREQLRAEYDARLFQTRAEIAAGVAGLDVLRRQMTELVAQIPAIEIFAGTTARAARRGDLSFAVAETAAQSLRDRQSGLAVLEQQITEQTIALELLAGGPSEGWTR